MSVDIFIERAAINLRMPPTSEADAELLTREIFAEVERFLEIAFAGQALELELPHVLVDQIVVAHSGALAVTVGRAIATAIVEATRCESAAPMHPQSAQPKAGFAVGAGSDAERAQRLPRRAQAVPVTAPGLESSRNLAWNWDECAGSSSGAAALAQLVVDSEDPLEWLLAGSRTGSLTALLSAVSDETAFALLDRLHRQLSRTTGVDRKRVVSGVEQTRFERACARAAVLLTAGSSRCQPPGNGPLDARTLVLAVGLLGRLTAAHVRTCVAVLHALDDFLLARGSLSGVAALTEAFLQTQTVASSTTVEEALLASPTGAPGELRRANLAPGGAACDFIDTTALTPSGRTRPCSDRPFDPVTLAEPIELSSPLAGLAFLIRPLQELGFSAALAAVHAEPTIVLSAVLRRITELCELEPRPDDPALWLLAGLLAAPDAADWSDDELAWSAVECAALARAVGGEASSYAGAVEVWARAVIADVEMHFAEAGANDVGVAEVVARHGDLGVEQERLVVTMRFPTIYEQLLRAGLLADVVFVPWLGGALAFVFEEQA